MIITGVAAQLRDIRLEHGGLAAELEARLEAHPLTPLLTSMPSVGFKTATKTITIIGDGSAFPTVAHLASYAGLAPVTRKSCTSIKGESHSQRGHHALKSALSLSAFAALKDPDSRAYFDRKHAHGRRHNAALIWLVPRRIDVLLAILRDGTLYRLGPADVAARLVVAA
jgi:transposase